MVTIPRGKIRENVTKAELTNVVHTGIRWGSLGADMVPLFEEHSVRIERGLNTSQWYELPAMERAMMVAQRRIDNAIKNVQTEAEIRASKRKQKR